MRLKICKDRTIRTVIPGAAVDQHLQRSGHVLQFKDPLSQFGDVCLGNFLDVGAAARGIAPQAQQLIDFRDGDPRSRARRMKRSIWTSDGV